MSKSIERRVAAKKKCSKNMEVVKMKKVIVKRNEDSPEPVEIIAQSIIDLSNSVKRIMGGRLNRKAVVLLLQSACGATKITKWQVELVLESLEDLRAIYIKKAEKQK